MRIFLSWSGERSKTIASAIGEWLPYVIQSAKPWISDHDIQAGTSWESELTARLENTDCGVLCLTPENVQAPWLLFEAGALSRANSNPKVIPYRIGLTSDEVPPPLKRFQGVDADEQGTLKLLNSLISSSPDPPSQKLIEELFEIFWPRLQATIESTKVSAAKTAMPSRSAEEHLEEILGILRVARVEQPCPDPPERRIELAVKGIVNEIDSLRGKIKSMEEYDRNGGGASYEMWWNPYVDRHRTVLQLLSEALEKLEEIKKINLAQS